MGHYLPRQRQYTAYIRIIRAHDRRAASHGLEHDIGKSLEQRSREQHVACGDMRNRIGALIGEVANIFQSQFTEAGLDRPLVGPGLAPRVADEQESPAWVPLVQDRGCIQRQQVVLGGRDGSHEAGNGNFLPRPESAAQRRSGCGFQVEVGKIDPVPHHVSAFGGYPMQRTRKC